MSSSLEMLEESLGSAIDIERIELLVELSLRNFKISPSKARSYAEEALSLAVALDSRLHEADALNALGKAKLGQLIHPEALENLHNALSLYEEQDSKNGIARTYGNIGLVHYSIGEYREALEFLERSRMIFSELGDRTSLASNLNSTALVLLQMDSDEEALKKLEESLSMAMEENDVKTIRSATNNKGMLHFKNGNFEEAIESFRRAAELSEREGELRSLAGNYINIGTSNIQLGRYDEAREFLNMGIETAERSEAWDFMVQGYHSLTELCEKESNFKKSLEYQRKMSEYENKIFSIEKSKAIAEIDARYQIENAKKEAETRRIRNMELADMNKLIEAQADSLRKANEEINLHKEELIKKKTELEKLLEEKDAFLSRMVEHISDGVMIDDLSGKIIYTNDRFLEIFGYSRDEILSMDPFKSVAPEWRESVRDYHKRRVAGDNVPDRFQFEGLKKGGSRIWLEVGVALVVQDGVVKGTQSLVRDITGRKLLEAQLLQSQKLDAVGRLAGGVAHDFNNLLTVIKGHSDFILTDIAGADPIRPDVEAISNAADRASALTRQLLAFSRQQILQPKVLDLTGVVSRLQIMMSRLLSEDIELTTNFAEDAGYVFADESQLEQVIVNLVINARDAMKTAGKLIIEVSNLDIDENSLVTNPDIHPGEYVLLSISDTGCGMNADTKERIFEPFFSTKLSANGTGLGLAMVYGIVKQSDGIIEVSSEPEVGTTFNIYLPRVDGEAAASEVQIVKSAESAKGESILIVEDNDELRKMLDRYLSRSGYKIRSSRTAEDLLEIPIESINKYNLLVTDIILPGINGVDLASRLKEGGFTGRTLYITGYARSDILPENLKKDDKQLLEKPFTLSVIGKRIRDILDSDD